MSMFELAVSSIAWTNEEEPEVAEKLVELGVTHVEIAPTKLWDDPTQVSPEDAKAYVGWWASRGIEVSAFQSMLFTRPDLKIFESKELYEATLDYLSRFIDLAGTMGAGKMVFGSPKNRQKGALSDEAAAEVAETFFNELGNRAYQNGTIFCLEPNAPQYNCDYIINAAEGSRLVREVDNSGFRLHLDAACMALAGDDIGASVRSAHDIMEHFHVSSPFLDQVEDRSDVNHRSAALALREVGYDKLISIEMRPGEVGSNAARVEKAVKFVKDVYLG